MDWKILLLASGLVACSGKDADDSEETTTPTDDTTQYTWNLDACEPPGSSKCDNPASILRGWVSIDPALKATNQSGDLLVILTHYRLGQGEIGGEYHIHERISGVDFSTGPVHFELDMCDGRDMWSEDNCEYNLLLLLDQNGDATADAYLPDIGEPSARIEDILISCEADSMCFDEIKLDCAAGQSCFQFANPKDNCDCGPTCKSEFQTCG